MNSAENVRFQIKTLSDTITPDLCNHDRFIETQEE